MRIKILHKWPKYGSNGYEKVITLVLAIYDMQGDLVAREERDIKISDIEDGEHYSFPTLKLMGIDV